MKIGAWFHTQDDLPLDQQIENAAQSGLSSIRCYHYGYAKQAAPALKQAGMSLLAGLNIDAAGLVSDWRSQVNVNHLAQYCELGVPLEAICVGNELREGGDSADKKRFSARLSFGLANLLETYRTWLDQHGFRYPLTYAMEDIVFDGNGDFHEWLWPLIDACDVVSINLYPVEKAAWSTLAAFEESRRFLCDLRTRHDRFSFFDYRLRRLLEQLERAGKPLILSETGFPSAVGYHVEGEHVVVPETDAPEFASAMEEFARLVAQANREHWNTIRAMYLYEWRDNPYHTKMHRNEHSPVRSAFGLCNVEGKPKLDIRRLVENAA